MGGGGGGGGKGMYDGQLDNTIRYGEVGERGVYDGQQDKILPQLLDLPIKVAYPF